ncbi:hypothetical protein GGS21DRAFT_523392 [Xylaria nigripes]|nr:hypothetical protein GGS21DRAFT_523392 [Xylaria nigripes]
MRNAIAATGTGLRTSKLVWSTALSRATEARRLLFPRLRRSPSRILALRLKSKNIHQKLTYRGPVRFGVSSRNGRLPILTLKTLLKKQDLSSENLLNNAMSAITEAEWKDIFNSLSTRGWTVEHIEQWVWVLSAKDGDARAERLVSTSHRNPIFMLLLLLRKDEVFRKTQSITSLVQYLIKNYIAMPSSPSHTDHVPNLRRILTITHFLIVIRRIAHHVRNVWPQSIEVVARLAIHYIKAIPNDPHHRHHRTDYRDQCRVYNTTLQCLSQPIPNQPHANMELNWRAQRLILAMSDNLEKPLIINKTSYQAIRAVLTGLKKSRKEKALAFRYTKTWPPYRQVLDGRDENRNVEEENDEKSRSLEAGVLMKEAGYSSDDYDQALDILGGTGEDFPTIQTRSLLPQQNTVDQAVMNSYFKWAMHIRSTRNAPEAWAAFRYFAGKTGLAPNSQVYNEMFIKLQAAPVDPDSSPDLLPGDSRETIPFHDANYSQYELARLSPPTVAELYAEMMNQGIKPRGIGLVNLVSNASSVEEGLRYLQDSGIPSHVIRAISTSGFSSPPSHRVLQRIPLLSFKSYIQLLCRLQPDRRMSETFHAKELYLIRYAIKLVETRLTPDSTAGVSFRPPWYTVLRALAGRHLAVANAPVVENNLIALNLFLDTLQSARQCIPFDAEIFILACRVIQKAALSQLMSLTGRDRVVAPLVPYPKDLLRLVTSAFAHLTVVTETLPGSSILSQFQFPLGSPHLHSYMRALAFLDAQDEMVKLLIWMMENYTYVNEEADRLGGRGHVMIAKSLCAFHALALPALGEHLQQQLNDRMDRLIESGGSWRWPTSEEVDGYIRADKSGGSDALHRRVAMRSFRNSMRSEGPTEGESTYFNKSI